MPTRRLGFAATSTARARRALAVVLGLALTAHAATVHAHGTRAGDLAIDHPYATPTAPGATVGAVYFRSLTNRGRVADRLIGARTPVAAEVRVHRLGGDAEAGGAQPSLLELPAGATLKLRHDGPTQLKLVGLKQPLRDGDRFALTLRFERAGEHEVTVWVQTPRASTTTP